MIKAIVMVIFLINSKGEPIAVNGGSFDTAALCGLAIKQVREDAKSTGITDIAIACLEVPLMVKPKGRDI